jgi:hypothetical protein
LARYQIKVAHELDRDIAAVFEGLELTAEGGTTVICGDLDQAALHGMLERLRVLGLELVEATRVPRTGDPRDW